MNDPDLFPFDPTTDLYRFAGGLFPDYLRRGNGMQHVQTTAAFYCRGRGVDVGSGKWPFPGATPVDRALGGDAMALPERDLDYVFSSHCLEHLVDPIAALEHWRDCLRPGGVLFLYLPHPDMFYWRPEYCRKHRHIWWPQDMEDIIDALGFGNIIRSERDLMWSFAIVGVKP